MKDIKKHISLKCSVCGNDQFSVVDETIEDMLSAPEEIEVKCSDCGRVTTKKQLIDENSYIINANIEDFKDDLLRELKKEFNNIFK